MRLPEFIIGGAPRSGTTWLYRLLDRHPDVRMAKPLSPEPKFFLRDDEYAKGLRYYSDRWFADVDASKVAGEKSTDYLENATAASRIARDLPRVRLIF
ncbi:MAG TPA: sulfotransferase, partial [Vicinamibacterales bacterium]|nr:sulfotransferase [Vicinamibacterales bacterium]